MYSLYIYSTNHEYLKKQNDYRPLLFLPNKQFYHICLIHTIIFKLAN